METISGNFLTSSLTEEFLINPSYLQNDQVLQQVIFDQIDSFFFSIEPKCVNWLTILLQCSVSEGDLHCQCILSIFPASMHQLYVNTLAFVNINPFFILMTNLHWSIDFLINQYTYQFFQFSYPLYQLKVQSTRSTYP